MTAAKPLNSSYFSSEPTLKCCCYYVENNQYFKMSLPALFHFSSLSTCPSLSPSLYLFLSISLFLSQSTSIRKVMKCRAEECPEITANLNAYIMWVIYLFTLFFHLFWNFNSKMIKGKDKEETVSFCTSRIVDCK